jgi:hypothetical protein
VGLCGAPIVLTLFVPPLGQYTVLGGFWLTESGYLVALAGWICCGLAQRINRHIQSLFNRDC